MNRVRGWTMGRNVPVENYVEYPSLPRGKAPFRSVAFKKLEPIFNGFHLIRGVLT